MQEGEGGKKRRGGGEIANRKLFCSSNYHITCKSNECIFSFEYLQASCGSDQAVN